jgi:hypothetical protein
MKKMQILYEKILMSMIKDIGGLKFKLMQRKMLGHN